MSEKYPLLVVFRDALPETNIAPENAWLVGILVSFWNSLFSGAMLDFGGVHQILKNSFQLIGRNRLIGGG